MTHSPQPENQPDPNSSKRLWLLILSRTSMALGAVLLIGIARGVWWAWNYITEKLAPQVEANLQQLLGRPVEIGQLQRFSLDSLRFGTSSIPATATDLDRIVAEAVEVEFDLWKLLLNQTLELNVTLVRPDVYVEQAQDSSWVSTEINLREGVGRIPTQLEAIRVQRAEVGLLPSRPEKPPVTVAFEQISGIARFLEQNQLIRYEVSGQPGSAIFSNLQGNINEFGQALGIDELQIFPTVVTDSTSDVSVLGLAAEAVFDLAENFSVSLSRVFATDEPFRYNLIYRLSEQLRLRGSTNLTNESRVLVEYEARF